MSSTWQFPCSFPLNFKVTPVSGISPRTSSIIPWELFCASLCLGSLKNIYFLPIMSGFSLVITTRWLILLRRKDRWAEAVTSTVRSSFRCKLAARRPSTRMSRLFRINYFDWFVQFTIWNMIVILAKSLMFELEILLSEPLISISTFLLGWIQPYQTFELILVIIIVPVIMNGFAFWFQDNFLKKKETEEADPP